MWKPARAVASSRLAQAVAFSLVLHLALAWLLKNRETKPLPPPEMVVELAPVPADIGRAGGRDPVAQRPRIPPRGSRPHAGPPASGGESNHASRLGLSDLGLGWNGNIPKGGTAGRENELDVDGGEEVPGPLGQFRRVSSYRYVYALLDDALVYPSEFKDKQIEGTVRARLVFSRTGEYMRKFSSVESADRFLRVLILRLLRAQLGRPLPEPYVRGNGLLVTCVFDFEHFPPLSDTESILGNRLHFTRVAHPEGRLGWQVGPFSGYALVPQVGINPEWFVEQLKSQRADEDPLKKWREDPEF